MFYSLDCPWTCAPVSIAADPTDDVRVGCQGEAGAWDCDPGAVQVSEETNGCNQQSQEYQGPQGEVYHSVDCFGPPQEELKMFLPELLCCSDPKF